MDPPGGQLNAQGWHQDRIYYPANRNGLNAAVCWIPCFDVQEEMGPLSVAPSRYLAKHVEHTCMKTSSHVSRIKLSIPERILSNYEQQEIYLQKRDVLIFSMLLFHVSGLNQSERFRFSVLGRYHNSSLDDFIPFLSLARFNRRVTMDLEESGIDCENVLDYREA